MRDYFIGYCEHHWSISLFDIRDFTKNPEESIKIYLASGQKDIYSNLLTYAVQLGQVVDFSWSERRIREEHQKQISKCREKEISNKKNDPIYETVLETKNIKLLNTEKDVFLEGETMSHCLYNCYFDRIKSKNYIAFHMFTPEDCTFSVRFEQDTPILDQIYLKHDFNVKPETKQIAIDFIKENESILMKMHKEKGNAYYR